MLPVVAGRVATTRQILIYSALLVPISLLPWALGFAGPIFGATAFVSGAILVGLAFQLSRSRETDRRAAHRLFVFSISYLFALFAALLADHSSDRLPSTLSSGGARTATGSVQAELFPCSVRTARSSFRTWADEV
jgi:protoheme IX farnesyltransferase